MHTSLQRQGSSRLQQRLGYFHRLLLLLPLLPFSAPPLQLVSSEGQSDAAQRRGEQHLLQVRGELQLGKYGLQAGEADVSRREGLRMETLAERPEEAYLPKRGIEKHGDLRHGHGQSLSDGHPAGLFHRHHGDWNALTENEISSLL